MSQGIRRRKAPVSSDAAASDVSGSVDLVPSSSDSSSSPLQPSVNEGQREKKVNTRYGSSHKALMSAPNENDSVEKTDHPSSDQDDAVTIYSGTDMEIDSNSSPNVVDHEQPVFSPVSELTDVPDDSGETPDEAATDERTLQKRKAVAEPEVEVAPPVDPIDEAFSAVADLPYVDGFELASARKLVKVVNLADALIFRDPKRVTKLTAHSGSPKIQNLSLCDPGRLSMGRWLRHNPSEPYSLFFLTGMTQFCNLFSVPAGKDGRASKQIGIVPFTSTWYRAIAVLGKVFGANQMFFSTYNGVLTVSTKTAPANNIRSPVSPIKTAGTVDGSLDYNAEVPVFDGRKPFKMSAVSSLKRITSDLEVGSPVMVIFTVHKYKPYGAQLEKYSITTSDTIVSLNIRGVVLLQGPSSYFSLENIEPADIQAEAKGVSFDSGIVDDDGTNGDSADAADVFGSCQDNDDGSEAV